MLSPKYQMHHIDLHLYKHSILLFTKINQRTVSEVDFFYMFWYIKSKYWGTGIQVVEGGASVNLLLTCFLILFVTSSQCWNNKKVMKNSSFNNVESLVKEINSNNTIYTHYFLCSTEWMNKAWVDSEACARTHTNTHKSVLCSEL